MSASLKSIVTVELAAQIAGQIKSSTQLNGYSNSKLSLQDLTVYAMYLTII